MAFKIALALAMAVTPSMLSAQQLVCGPNGCTYSRAPIRSAVRPFATVYRPAMVTASAQASRPMVVRRGLFGRRVVARTYAPPTVASSYGSSGSAATYAAPVVRSYSMPAAVSSGSNGGGYLSSPPAEPAAEVDEGEDFGATVPKQSKSAGVCPCGPNCPCGGVCECGSAVAYVPATREPTSYAVVPPARSVNPYAIVPAIRPVETLASL